MSDAVDQVRARADETVRDLHAVAARLELARIAALPDPGQRAAQAASLMRAWDDVAPEARQIRDEAVDVLLAEGALAKQDIAALTGVTPTMISRRARHADDG